MTVPSYFTDEVTKSKKIREPIQSHLATVSRVCSLGLIKQSLFQVRNSKQCRKEVHPPVPLASGIEV